MAQVTFGIPPNPIFQTVTITGTGMTVADGFILSSAGSIALTAGGSNKNVTITPSGTGGIAMTGNAGIAGGGINDTIAVTVGSPTMASGTNSFGIFGASTVPAATTGTFVQFNSNPRTIASSFVLGALAHFSVSTTIIGAGSSITEMNGFRVSTGMTQATINYGFRGSLATSGTARWNIFMDGTAPNFLAGSVKLGSTTGTDLTDASGAFTLTGGTGNMTVVGGTGNGRTLTLKTTNSSGTAINALVLNSTQDTTLGGSITTANPNSGTAAAWKLGTAVTGVTTTFLATSYIQVDISGTLYKLAIVTSVP